MKKYFCQYRHRRGSGMITLFLLFFLLSSGSVLGQVILFYEDFGDPTLATERRIWPYMPTGNNSFIFADPDAPDLVYGSDEDQAKKIENNFYAVINPRRIYSSVYPEGWNGYKLWDPIGDGGIVDVGDATPEHNGDGGALVVNAGTTLASIYSRPCNLKPGHYYKLSYKLFVVNASVKISHQIISMSGNSKLAVLDGKLYEQRNSKWQEQTYWFHMPVDCDEGSFGLSIVNDFSQNIGNDYALDDIYFFDMGTDRPEGVEIAEIACGVIEPVAANDILELKCKDIGQSATFDSFLINDMYNGKQIDINQFGAELLVPAGTNYTPGSWGGEWGAGEKELQKIVIDGEGTWVLKESRTAKWDAIVGVKHTYGFITITFTPIAEFKDNPTPISYRLYARDGSGVRSNDALLSINYDCNPLAVDDTATMQPGSSVTIDILENDATAEGDKPQPSDVKVLLVNPFNPLADPITGSLEIEGEGTWSYDAKTGGLTFTSVSGFLGEPTPIYYVFEEDNGDGKRSNRAKVTITLDESVEIKNYWIGGTIGAPNDWDEEENWTARLVPKPGEDVEFATEANNGVYDSAVPHSGPAKEDLYLGDGITEVLREIGNLINDSDKDLWVTTGDMLIVKGKVEDNNPAAGTIVVKADPLDEKPSGTLIFEDPTKNLNVGATVEFYNKAYDCADCGFYTRSWQYFGIPLQQSTAFPYDDVDGNETVNQWVEPFNGNKWQPAPHTPNDKFEAFRGYQITNDVNEQPEGIYSFEGDLYVGDASVAVTRTDDANYPGANLVGNSYTAAIPISGDALTFPAGVEETVYLFNTGTRDQWRKLNGTAINGYRSGQYLAVPVDLGGQDDFPDRIPSMHAFMVLAQSGSGGNLGIDYSKLVKNTTVNRGNGEQIVTRSVNNKGTTTAKSTIPSLVMDVIGEQSADRIWIFTKEGTTNGFDNGWDGRKMAESGIVQFYVADEADKDHFQVATVPGLDNLPLGFEADVDGEYTIEFALSDHWANEEIYLNDLASGTQTRITNGGSYRFAAKKGDSSTRFSLSSSGGILTGGEAAKITVSSIDAGKITIHNRSDNDCSVFISNTAGKLLKRLEVVAGDEQTVEDMPGGTHVVRLQNGVINDGRKIVVR